MDRVAFWELIDEMQPNIFRLALSILSNKQEAEDALHEIILKVWRKRKDLNKDQFFRGYIMKVAKNHCIDLLRKYGRHLELTESQCKHVHQNYEEQDMVSILKIHIQSLPIQQRMIVELKDVQGYSYEEIASILDKPVTNLRMNLSRARKSLINAMNDEEK